MTFRHYFDGPFGPIRGGAPGTLLPEQPRRDRQVESTNADPYAARRANAFKWQQGIYLLFGVI